ncbi:hypothetical protein BpHYR1_054113 [Brachionus plicatilis]|uniref:Uncharacterized protein n=1 Tax=Brachionus plicatilis TaxID=10195 RepID=A0A3M7SMV2_BRAPC|nr:hypothetical protein BpHYR1_054113 [Brachionus plicatilis]
MNNSLIVLLNNLIEFYEKLLKNGNFTFGVISRFVRMAYAFFFKNRKEPFILFVPACSRCDLNDSLGSSLMPRKFGFGSCGMSWSSILRLINRYNFMGGPQAAQNDFSFFSAFIIKIRKNTFFLSFTLHVLSSTIKLRQSPFSRMFCMLVITELNEKKIYYLLQYHQRTSHIYSSNKLTDRL